MKIAAIELSLIRAFDVILATVNVWESQYTVLPLQNTSLHILMIEGISELFWN